MGPNPILVREFRARWRGKPAFAILFGYATLLAIACGTVYSSTSTTEFSFREHRMSQIGHELFVGLNAVQIFTWMLLATVLGATSIATEREEGMLELLQLSPLSALRIANGKLLSCLSFLVLLLLAPLPVISMCFLMGGVSPGEFIAAALLQFSTIICCVIIGMFFSARSQHVSTAVGMALATILAWGLGSALVTSFSWVFGATATAANWLEWLLAALIDAFVYSNPILATFDVQPARLLWGPGGYPIMMPSWAIAVALEILASCLLYALVIRLLRRPLPPLDEITLPKRPSGKSSTHQASPGAGRVPGWYGFDLSRFIQLSNPVLQRELQRRLRVRVATRKRRWPLCCVVIVLVCSYLWILAWAILGSRSEKETLVSLGLLFNLVIILIMPAFMGSITIAREREAKTWDALQLSLLTKWQIIVGKIWPPLSTCWLVSGLISLLALPGIDRIFPEPGHTALSDVLSFQGILTFAVWNAVCFGMRMSWEFRRSWIAVCATLAVLVGLYVFVPMFVLYSASPVDSEPIAFTLAFWHPLFALMALWDSYERSHYHVEPLVIWLCVAGVQFLCGWVSLLVLYRKMTRAGTARRSESDSLTSS